MDLYPLKPTQAERAQLVLNLNGVYHSATRSQIERGLFWYQAANDLARIIGADARQGAGLIAALSAQREWSANVKLATRAAKDLPIKTIAEQERKVRYIQLGGDPADVLPMEVKTGKFYRAILGDLTAVVVDRHIHDAARGAKFGQANRGLSYLKRYRIFEDAVVESARQCGLSPRDFQAVVWVVWTDGTDHEGFAPEEN